MHNIILYILISAFGVTNILFLLYYACNQDRHYIINNQLQTNNKEKFSTKKTWQLFNVSKCVGRDFSFYAYNLNSKLTHSSSAISLQNALLNSPYSIRNPSQACLFVYVAHGEEDLTKLNFWNQNGERIVVIFASGSTPPFHKYPNRRAFFVGEGMNYASFIDIQLFVQQQKEKTTKQELRFEKRTFLFNMIKDCENSTFTILHPQIEHFAQRFHETLLYGSIPVFIGDKNDANLPFHDLIQWKRAILFFPSYYIHEIETTLSKISVEQIIQLKRNGRFYFENYLLGADKLVRSIFTAYRHRLKLLAPKERLFKADIIYSTHSISTSNQQTLQTLSTEEHVEFAWNKNPVYMDERPLIPVRYLDEPPIAVDGQQTINGHDRNDYQNVLSGNYPNEKFTAVMVAYKRDEQVKYTLQMLNNVRFIDRILLVWNDYNRSLPNNLIPQMNVPTFVLNISRNSLHNKFLPFDLILTEAVFVMDDDFNDGPETIEFSFRVWRENRFTIVGPNFRVGFIDKNQTGKYVLTSRCQQNLILTSGVFFHRLYLRAYQQMITPTLYEHIDQTCNCDDLFANFLIAHLSRKPPIKTTPYLNRPGKKSPTGLRTRGNSHYLQRSECISLLVKEFDYNPLIISEYRADSISYGTRNYCYETT